MNYFIHKCNIFEESYLTAFYIVATEARKMAVQISYGQYMKVLML